MRLVAGTLNNPLMQGSAMLADWSRTGDRRRYIAQVMFTVQSWDVTDGSFGSEPAGCLLTAGMGGKLPPGSAKLTSTELFEVSLQEARKRSAPPSTAGKRTRRN
jgi:hypothetical protein